MMKKFSEDVVAAKINEPSQRVYKYLVGTVPLNLDKMIHQVRSVRRCSSTPMKKCLSTSHCNRSGKRSMTPE